MVATYEDARAEAGSRIAAARALAGWPAPRGRSKLSPAYPSPTSKRPRDVATGDSSSGGGSTSQSASPERRHRHPLEPDLSNSIRPDLVMHKSQQQLDLNCMLYIQEDIQALEQQAATSNDYDDRRQSELWSLRSYTADEVVFPHGDLTASGRGDAGWFAALCRELGQIGRRPDVREGGQSRALIVSNG